MTTRYIGVISDGDFRGDYNIVKCYEILARSAWEAEQLLKAKHPEFKDWMICKLEADILLEK